MNKTIEEKKHDFYERLIKIAFTIDNIQVDDDLYLVDTEYKEKTDKIMQIISEIVITSENEILKTKGTK